MLVTPEGIVTLVSDVALLKALLPILVTLDGIEILASEVAL